MNETILVRLRDLIQEDVGRRGLATDPEANLLTATKDDFAAACRSLAETARPTLAIVTGFFIPHAQPPAGETDGPLGALFLARALVPLGFHVILASDGFCVPALQAALAVCGLRKAVPVITLPTYEQASQMSVSEYQEWFAQRSGTLTHLLALERVGPSHTLNSFRNQLASTASSPAELFHKEVPGEHHDRCHTMRGRDITAMMSPVHRLFEAPNSPVTIGIGDGGNEIGMGKIPWDIIRRNVPGGGLVACRIATDHLIVSGISNWGAYGLACGVSCLRGHQPDPELFDLEIERNLLETMVERGPLVDGISGLPTPSVDGLAFDQYASILPRLAEAKAS